MTNYVKYINFFYYHKGNSKLYFEVLKIFSAPQNNLPLCCTAGEGRYSEVMRPIINSNDYTGSLHRSLNSLNSLDS